jgi:hypothetical protein
MIYFELNSDGSVGLIHYQPFDPENGLGKTQDELLQTGFLVDSIPEATPQEGKTPILHFNSSNKTFYYDYVINPPSEIDRIAALEDAITALMGV